MTKKVLSIMLTILMVFSVVPLSGLSASAKETSKAKTSASYSGKCGDNARWSFDDSTGELKITGTGAMNDYTADTVPWSSFKSEILKITIASGITSIGEHAFSYDVSVVSVTIPDTVTKIGSEAFYKCSALTTIDIPFGVTDIDSCAFKKCTSLVNVSLPESLNSTNVSIFDECTSLTSITIPASLNALTSCMFADCSSLKEITIPYSIKTVEYGAFLNCTALTDVYYKGSSSEWERIVIDEEKNLNAPLINAEKHYEVSDDDIDYLKFTSDDAFSITIPRIANTFYGTLEYSYDKETWVNINKGDTISSSSDSVHVLYMRGEGNDCITNGQAWKVSGGESGIYASGNMMTLLNYRDPDNATMIQRAFEEIFKDWTTLVTGPKLPATALSEECYFGMFWGCTSLKVAPDLPATTLYKECYAHMFDGTSIKVAPELPATKLAEACYAGMFEDCTNLIKAPKLPATKLESMVYSNMFEGCENLETPPELPATEATDSCYYGMFEDCTNLKTAPELPATKLDYMCYCLMFSHCSSLTKAPDLPATTLAESCYDTMFYYCTSLTDIPEELPATDLTDCDYCYYMMFAECYCITTAPKLPATSLSNDCYERMFNDCYKLKEAPELPATVLPDECYEDMFNGCYSFTRLPDLTHITEAGSWSMNEMFYDIPGLSLCSTGTGDTWTSPNVSSDDCMSDMFGLVDGSSSIIDSDSATPEQNKIYYYEPDYLTFKSDDTFTITIPIEDKFTNLEYSTDKRNWNTVDPSADVTVTAEDGVVYFRGKDNKIITGENASYRWVFEGDFDIEASGNIMTILDYTDPDNATMDKYAFGYIFAKCENLTTSPKLPATTLSESCYEGMFMSCTGLTEAPKLPATTLGKYCYRTMFAACTGLEEAPMLSANTLSDGCYAYMFYGDTKLAKAPALPADELASQCYLGMFNGCTKIEKTPELSATTLASDCYKNMFENCTGLIETPELSATKLASGCYYMMFANCTGLTETPVLSATSLPSECYLSMFSGCTGLTKLPIMTQVTYAEGSSMTGMFYNCSGIALYKNGAGEKWTSPNVSNEYMTSMLSNTGGDNIGTPDQNTTYYYSPASAATPFDDAKYYSSLTLNDKVDVNFTIKNINTATFDIDKFTINGSNVDSSCYDSSKGTIDVKLCTKKLAELSDSENVVLKYNDSKVKSTTVSVGKYGNAVLNSASYGESSDLGKVCKAILNLGATAYEEFNTGTTSNFNEGHELDFDSIDFANASEIVRNDSLTSAQLKLDEGVAMKLSYTTSSDVSSSDFKIVNNLGEYVTADNITVEKTSTGYDLIVSNMGATKLSRNYTVTCANDSSLNATVSVYALCKLGANNTSYATLANLYKALYNYGECAKAFPVE